MDGQATIYFNDRPFSYEQFLYPNMVEIPKGVIWSTTTDIKCPIFEYYQAFLR